MGSLAPSPFPPLSLSIHLSSSLSLSLPVVMRLSLNFCGPKCSHCCFVLSIWGILMLLVLGGLFHANSRALIEDAAENTKDAMEDAAKNCYIAAAIYVGTLAISYWQMRLSRTASERAALEQSYSSY